MKITFSGHEFILDASGAFLWPQESLLVVSDLHLEKSSHFARRGFFLPPYDSQATLARLADILRKSGMQRLLILGDCFHDEKGYDRMSPQNRDLFDGLSAYNPIWIQGNHDGSFVPPGITGHFSYRLQSIVFRHEAIVNMPNEISGHFHPKIAIQHKGGRISRPCFIENGSKMIIPAFGSLTGGLEINDPAIASHFTGGADIHVLGQDRVYSLRNFSVIQA